MTDVTCNVLQTLSQIAVSNILFCGPLTKDADGSRTKIKDYLCVL